jgi:hypothetical protein
VGLPGTVPQLLILVAFVLPGVVYQSVRSRLRGPTPDELDATTKVLRATAASTLLALIYGIFLGPAVRDALRGSGWLYDHPRSVAVLGLFLLFVIPVLVAVVEQLWVRWKAGLPWGEHLMQYNPTPSAWDFAFRDLAPCFLRVLTDDGRWVGGWFDATSFASSFPQPREIFIAAEWIMGEDGEFQSEVDGSLGVYVRCDDIRAVEFIAPQDNDRTGVASDTGGRGRG